MSGQYTGGAQYNEGCSVHWEDIMSTVEGYHEYTGGAQYIGGYHEYTGDSMINVGEGHWENN